jgi:hypothetical protein
MPGERNTEAGRAIRAAIDRGAFSQDRAAYWAERVVTADDPRAIVAAIDLLVGRDGPDEDEFEDEDEFMHLYPPQPGREDEWEASRLAASARQAAGELTDDEVASLYPPGSFEEADQRITASARPRPQRAVEWPDEELHAAVFGDSTFTGPGGFPAKGRRS